MLLRINSQAEKGSNMLKHVRSSVAACFSRLDLVQAQISICAGGGGLEHESRERDAKGAKAAGG